MTHTVLRLLEAQAQAQGLAGNLGALQNLLEFYYAAGRRAGGAGFTAQNPFVIRVFVPECASMTQG